MFSSRALVLKFLAIEHRMRSSFVCVCDPFLYALHLAWSYDHKFSTGNCGAQCGDAECQRRPAATTREVVELSVMHE